MTTSLQPDRAVHGLGFPLSRERRNGERKRGGGDRG
jgi:hypothetical protein